MNTPDSTFTELSQFALSEEVITLISLEFCLENNVVVLGDEKNAPSQGRPVGMLNPKDKTLLLEVERQLKCQIIPVQLNEWEIRHALAEAWVITDVDDNRNDMMLLKESKTIDFSPKKNIQELWEEILSVAVKQRATDVHIECYREDVDLRFRVDGVLHQVTSPISIENVAKCVSALKIISRLKITEKRRPQNGAFRSHYITESGEEKIIDMRVAILPGPFGEDTVIRLLDKIGAHESLSQLGMNDRTIEQLKKAIQNTYGLVLIAGPTGAGKSSTFYSIIEQINVDGNKILSIEDPIEYEMNKVNQKQVSSLLGFADYTKAFMRQDPDILLVGEINDEETALACIRASQVGKMVYSTLHANDAIGIVMRLQLLGIQHDILAENLVACLSQRLLRVLCPSCRTKEIISEENKVYFKGLDHGEEQWVAVGCDDCDAKGYKGRTGVYEIMLVNSKIKGLISSKASMSHIREEALSQGFETLVVDALAKAREGITSLDEVRRVVQVW